MTKHSRKHYLILPSYQIRLVTIMSLMVFVCSILHGIVLYHFTGTSMADSIMTGADLLTSIKPVIIVANSLSFIVMSVFILIITLLISHRLVGPMFKVAGHLRKMAAGKMNLPELRLREADEGQILCQSVNELQGKLKERFDKLNALNRDASDMTNNELRAALEEIVKGIEVDETAE